MPRRVSRKDEPSTSRGTHSKRSLPKSESESESSAEEQSRTRTSRAAPVSTVDIATLSNNMVKYLLNYSATKFPIKRAEVIKNVNFNQKLFPEVFNSAREKLLEIFGLEVSEVAESKSSKALIVHSSFNSVVTAIQHPPEQRNETTLLFIVLSYIFMKGGEVQEGQCCGVRSKPNTLKISIFSSPHAVPRTTQYRPAGATSTVRRRQQADQGSLHATTLPQTSQGRDRGRQ